MSIKFHIDVAGTEECHQHARGLQSASLVLPQQVPTKLSFAVASHSHKVTSRVKNRGIILQEMSVGHVPAQDPVTFPGRAEDRQPSAIRQLKHAADLSAFSRLLDRVMRPCLLPDR